MLAVICNKILLHEFETGQYLQILNFLKMEYNSDTFIVYYQGDMAIF